LDQDSAQRINDLLENSLNNNKYAVLKDRLMNAFDLSEHERAARLLYMPPLENRKPTTLMDEMFGLLGNLPLSFSF